MDKHIYRQLLRLVNEPEIYAALHTYMEARRERLMRQLEHANDMDTVRRIQGALGELVRISTLRDEVLEGAKDGKA